MCDSISFKATKKELYERFQNVAANRQANVQLILEHVASPGNLGAIARSCDAFGIQDIHYLPTKRHRRENYLILRSSASASQWLDFTSFTSTEEHFNRLHAQGWHILATSSEVSGISLYDVDFTQYPKLAIAIGSEGHGLSPTALAKADHVITIPTHSIISSLNVSVATAIILAELHRQRKSAPFLLAPQAQQKLVTTFIARYLRKRSPSIEKLPIRNSISTNNTKET